ncbi:hypothetical protein RhiJN_17384 [Ceratobasidium sp. AG-Ba]|nr:hypothetical protein RhiJN_17384 [Ceratobasidium sp. AG-Ba]
MDPPVSLPPPPSSLAPWPKTKSPSSPTESPDDKSRSLGSRTCLSLTRFATMYAPSCHVAPISARSVYPPASVALTAPIDKEDEAAEWKEMQGVKGRADIVVKDGELSVADVERSVAQ